jgi:hypothetical protein
MLAVMLFVTAVGAFNLDSDGLWIDEWWSLYNAGSVEFDGPLTPVQILERVREDDPWQTPGYPLMLAAWGSVVGWTVPMARALSLLAGVLTVALTYRFALALSRDRHAALASAVIMSGSAWFMNYTHELRTFMIYALATAAFIYAYWRISRRPRASWMSFAAVVLSGILLVSTHAFALFVYGVVGLWHVSRLFTRAGRRGWIAASVSLFIPLALFLPWFTVLLNTLQTARDIERVRVGTGTIVDTLTDVLFVFSNSATPLFVLLALFSIGRRGWRTVWLLLLCMTAAFVAGYTLGRLDEPRYSYPVLPMLALIGGLGAAALRERRIPALVVYAVWVIPGVVLGRDPRLVVLMRDYTQPTREMSAALMPYLNENTVVIDYLGDGVYPTLQAWPFVYYIGNDRVRIVDRLTNRTLEQFIAHLDSVVADRDQFLLTHTPFTPGSEWALVQYRMGELGIHPCRALVAEREYAIDAYARAGAADFALTFGETRIGLIGALHQTDAHVIAWIGVQSNAPLPTHSLALHLVDANGALVAQDDQPIPVMNDGCILAVLPVRAVPPGEYMLRAIAYSYLDGARVPGTDATGASSDTPTLTMLQVR